MNAREGRASETSQTESVQPVRQDALLMLCNCASGKVKAEPEKLLQLLKEAFGCDLSMVAQPLTMEASERLLYRVCAAYGVRGLELGFDHVTVQEGPLNWENSTFGSARDRLRASSGPGDGHYIRTEPGGVGRKAYVEGDNVFFVTESREASFILGTGLIAECKRASEMPKCRSFLILRYLHHFVEELCSGMPATCFNPWALSVLFEQPLDRARWSLASVFVRPADVSGDLGSGLSAVHL